MRQSVLLALRGTADRLPYTDLTDFGPRQACGFSDYRLLPAAAGVAVDGHAARDRPLGARVIITRLAAVGARRRRRRLVDGRTDWKSDWTPPTPGVISVSAARRKEVYQKKKNNQFLLYVPTADRVYGIHTHTYARVQYYIIILPRIGRR